MTGRGRRTGALAVTGALLVGLPFLVALGSDAEIDWTAVRLIALDVALSAGLAVLLSSRPRYGRLAWLVMLLAATTSAQGLTASDQSWVFTLGRVLGQASAPVAGWLVLAIPSGRLFSRGERLLVASAAFVNVVLWIPTQMFQSVLAREYPVAPCAGACPSSVLFVASRPDLVRWAELPFRVSGSALALVFGWMLIRRLRNHGRSIRRMVLPITLVALVRVVFTESLLFRLGGIPTWALMGSYLLAAPAILLGLTLGRLSTGQALLGLVAGLRRGPDLGQLRDAMAEALEDPRLVLYAWVPASRAWSGPEGLVGKDDLRPWPGRAVRVLSSYGEPLAAVEFESGLLVDADRLEAVLDTARAALERTWANIRGDALEAQAADAESLASRRLRRDLHDGAQQRLIALRIKVNMLRNLVDQDPVLALDLVDELRLDVDAALTDVRQVAHGGGPSALADGLGAALERAVREAPVDGTVSITDVGTYPRHVEEAIYYTVREALQNVAKHVGPGAAVEVTLTHADGALVLTVADNGPGAGLGGGAIHGGEGVGNMRERFVACGGAVDVRDGTGSGVVVTGWIPVEAAVAPGGRI